MNTEMEKEVYVIEGIILRRAKIEDLVHFDAITSPEYFDLGLHNWQLYYSLSPNDYWVIVDPEVDKIIGLFAGNELRKDLYWGQQVVILADYRRRKIFRRMQNIVLNGRFFCGNRNKYTIASMVREPCYFGHKQIGYFGTCTAKKNWSLEPPASIKIILLGATPSSIDAQLLAQIYDYDDRMYADLPTAKTKRRLWLNQWLFPSQPGLSYSVVAYSPRDNTVHGYGVVRRQTSYYSVAPLYADNDDIAYALFSQIGNGFQNGEKLYLEFHANRRACFKFVNECCMQETYSNFRVYTSYVPNLPIEKMYCDNEYWPL